MFLGAYHFDGDPDVLLAGHRRLLETYPPASLELHVAVKRENGITVFDACPSREVFTSFSTSPEFTDALREAGVPAPRIELLGDVAVALLRERVG